MNQKSPLNFYYPKSNWTNEHNEQVWVYIFPSVFGGYPLILAKTFPVKVPKHFFFLLSQ